MVKWQGFTACLALRHSPSLAKQMMLKNQKGAQAFNVLSLQGSAAPAQKRVMVAQQFGRGEIPPLEMVRGMRPPPYLEGMCPPGLEWKEGDRK